MQATKEQVRQMLAEAEQNGQTKRAEYLRSKLGVSTPAPTRTPTSKVESAWRGAAQGASFGTTDEGSGLMGALMDTLLGDPAGDIAAEVTGQPRASFGDRYSAYRDDQRQQNTQARQDNPWTYGLSEFVGGVAVPGGATFKGAQAASKARSTLRPLGAVAASGAATGAAAGLGYSEGETAGEIAGDTAMGAGIGAVAAPAISSATNFITKGAANAGGRLKRAFDTDHAEQARLKVGQALQDEGLTDPAVVRAKLAELGPDGTLADIGSNLQQLAVVAAKVPGPGRRLAQDFVESRQAGQQSRLQKLVRDTLDPKWTDMRGFTRQLTKTREAQASEAYAAAYLQPVRPTPELASLSRNNDYFKQALERAVKNVKNKVNVGSSSTDVAADGMISTRMMDQVMRELRDMSQGAYLKGRNELGSDIKAVRDVVRAEMFKQNPHLERAMSIHRGGKELEEAAGYGRAILQKKTRLDELQGAMEEWSESEIDAFRVGLMQGMFDKLEDVATSQNSARFAAPQRVRSMLREAFKDGDTYEKFMRGVDAETAMQGTRNKVTGGSPTMELQSAERGGLPQMAPGRSVVEWIQTALRWLGTDDPALSRLKPEDYGEISKLLFRDVDDQTLEKLVAPTLGMRIRAAGASSNPGAATAGGVINSTMGAVEAMQ